MAEPAYALLPADEVSWPAQGQWTWDDYLRLPDDGQRYEIIGGVLYVSPSPTFDHQFSLAKLFARINEFVEDAALGLVLMAPFDVILPGLASPVQPDLLFLSAGREPVAGDRNLEGVPDLVVEVLSPGSSRLDHHVKFAAYEKAGVKEYWLVDPKSRSIAVHVLDADRGEYVELGHWRPGESARSSVLEGFETSVSPLFPPSL